MERERDQLLFHTGNVNSAAAKSSRRKIEEAHFSKAREEWQRRLRAADLKESDWDRMNEAEMKAVEEALGVDDGEGYITDPSPSPPHWPVFSSAAAASSSSSSAAPVVLPENKTSPGSSSSLIAPPMTTASRTTSSASSSYECVKPEEFHSDDDESTSDSEFSTFSTTISSIISEEDEVVGPVTEYMFTQALERRPLEVVAKDNGPLIARSVSVTSPSKSAEPATSGPPPPAPPKRPPDVNCCCFLLLFWRRSCSSARK
jgi:hypothetical protein